MVNLIRSAKFGSDWTDNELLAYNITIASLPPEEFFRTPDPSLDRLDPAILTSAHGDTNSSISDVAADYLGYLDLAASATQENFIDDFAAATLRLLRFNERGIAVSTHYNIPLTICGEANCVAQADVCLIHNPTFVLLVLVKVKTLMNGTVIDSESRVIAVAIATFQFNNRKRREHALDPLDSITIPCIKMTGTRPTFYLVPVTAQLSNAVITGQYPAMQTQALRCATAATHIRRFSAGMEDVEYRKLALKRFLAFKTLARSHWVHILEGMYVENSTVAVNCAVSLCHLVHVCCTCVLYKYSACYDSLGTTSRKRLYK